MIDFSIYIEFFAKLLEGMGVIIIVSGTLFFFGKFLLHSAQHNFSDKRYTELKHGLGKTILLGLEILVAGDIIRTVIVTPTLEQALTLGIIILIRTLLSFSLHVEIEGKLPWNKGHSKKKEIL